MTAIEDNRSHRRRWCEKHFILREFPRISVLTTGMCPKCVVDTARRQRLRFRSAEDVNLWHRLMSADTREWHENKDEWCERESTKVL
jgi:hypothetical protein